MPLPAILGGVAKIGAVAGKAAVSAAKVGTKVATTSAKGVAKGAKATGKVVKKSKITPKKFAKTTKKSLDGIIKKREQAKDLIDNMKEKNDRRDEEKKLESKKKLKPSKSGFSKSKKSIFDAMAAAAAGLLAAVVIKYMPQIIDAVKQVIQAVSPFFITVGESVGKLVNFLRGFSPQSEGYEEQKGQADSEIAKAGESADLIKGENDSAINASKSVLEANKNLREKSDELEDAGSDKEVGKVKTDEPKTESKVASNEPMQSEKVFDKSHMEEKGYRIGQVNPDTIVSSSEVLTQKTTDSTKKGGILGKFFNRDYDKFKEKDLGRGKPGLSMQTIEKYKVSDEQGTIKGESILTEDIASVGLPDIIEHQEDLLKRINAVKGFEDKTIDDVIGGTVGMDAQQYTRLLNSSDAARATEKKQELARKLDKKAGITYLNLKETEKILNFDRNKKNLETLNNTDNLTTVNGNGKTIIIKQRQIVEKPIPYKV